MKHIHNFLDVDCLHKTRTDVIDHVNPQRTARENKEL